MSSDRSRFGGTRRRKSDRKEEGNGSYSERKGERERESKRETFFLCWQEYADIPKEIGKETQQTKSMKKTATAAISNEKGEVGIFFSIISKGHFYHYKLLTFAQLPSHLHAIEEA